MRLRWRPFHFSLDRTLVTAQGRLSGKRGWLLRLETPQGEVGWGEAADLEPGVGAPAPLAGVIGSLGELRPQADLEAHLPELPPPLAFAIGGALAELEGLGRSEGEPWREAPVSAVLLPAGEAMLADLEGVLADPEALRALHTPSPPTFKWKVAAVEDALERGLLERLLERLPAGARLRLDANGGWDRPTAAAWADRLADEPRLDWLEEPLPGSDPEGLAALAARVPVALDESLRERPHLRRTWGGWQVRRPALEGDPRPLLAELRRGVPRLCLSTALETGIGWRLLAHLAALQQAGPTPIAPGLAPGWRPEGGLFAADPQRVWEAAG